MFTGRSHVGTDNTNFYSQNHTRFLRQSAFVPLRGLNSANSKAAESFACVEVGETLKRHLLIRCKSYPPGGSRLVGGRGDGLASVFTY